MPLKRVYIVLAIVVAMVAGGLGVSYALIADRGGVQVRMKGDRTDPDAAGAEIGGSFQLVDHRGRAVSSADFHGQHLLIFFGYTHCPDVCPTTMLELTQALDMLGDAAKQVQPLFITVDPLRDRPKAIADYLESFHDRFVGLTGTRQQIAAVERAYAVYGSRADAAKGGEDDYLVDHTTIVYLMGPDGRFLTFVRAGTPAADIAAKVRKYL